MDEVSDTIHDQKKILKEEMVQVIDKKIDDKIKAQLQEINDLQAKINKLKQGNNEVNASVEIFDAYLWFFSLLKLQMLNWVSWTVQYLKWIC